jgi:hypothetical protein
MHARSRIDGGLVYMHLCCSLSALLYCIACMWNRLVWVLPKSWVRVKQESSMFWFGSFAYCCFQSLAYNLNNAWPCRVKARWRNCTNDVSQVLISYACFSLE